MDSRSEIISQQKHRLVKISGFDCVDKELDMITWLHRGEDFRQFVVDDVESALCEQDDGAQLQLVECIREPEYKTEVQPHNDGSSLQTVMYFMVMFPLMIIVTGSDGVMWKLDIEYKYEATPSEKQKEINLCQNFKIIKQQRL